MTLDEATIGYGTLLSANAGSGANSVKQATENRVKEKMAAYDLEEQERIDALKDWWEKWGKLVYAVVGAFLLGMAGVNAWRYYQSTQQADAEVLFRSVEKTAQEVTASKEFKKLSEAANAMAEKFPRTFQATDAQLLAAKAAFEANDLAAAATHLQWVADKGRDAYKPLAKVRLASVQLDDKKFDSPCRRLTGSKDEGFSAMVADLRGDILAARARMRRVRPSGCRRQGG
jgi:predicted negative regulator of RcsB-dependent stress response